ncbi:Ig-like domain-containing protein [Paraburkholderia sp. MMS20-SJTR3]|uniref:Ig-like domain-containing protein n=1 Tax=Paraburkholderia sejongensis TaxID=2886946 RepID=A0ABS8K209_9BURK|nr:Ig-like domain-containing protein [Paraburkholderia sp. MMS20-SJTR3]MCC8396203.1 Ig-like domain-containing protein [Paraburkholderia sp. MMS20-SJTR3]
MAERMRSAADIIAEMKRKFSEAFEGANGQECISCRVTFKVFKSFPDVSYAQTMNQQTGEMIPTSLIKALSSGYEMRQAIGETQGCRCIDRPTGPFDERFTVRDRNGNPIANVPYRIFADNREICSGRTNAAGQTSRVATQGFKFLKIDVEG